MSAEIYNSPLETRGRRRLYIYGRSGGGRYLFVVLERLAPRSFFLLSARGMTPGERRKYGQTLKEDT